MKWPARLGRALAFAGLFLLYPPLGVFFHGTPSGLMAAGIVAGLAVFVAVYAWFWLRGYRSPSAGLVTAVVGILMGLGVLINVVSGAWSVNPFIFPIVIAGYAYRPRLAVAAVLGLTAIAMAVIQPAVLALSPTAADVVVLGLIASAQLLIIGFGVLGVSRLVATISELRAAREQIARLAVDQERMRFARDVHDLMGHSLSVITLKGELASQLIEAAPAQAQSEIRDIVRVAREALREVREAVSGYRQPTLANEIAGARAALMAAGIDCRVEQSAGALTRDAEAVLAWTVREGATNVIRHSKAKRCSILLGRDDEEVRLDVVDDGAGGATPQAGNGLRGLGERIRGNGGRLEAGPLPYQGFRLRVTLPVGERTAAGSQREAQDQAATNVDA
ncbi:MAG TPA: sensor histidine kinase [Candidatus Dormibacteraeota bacterium]|nr:sensor histidine kinase [Candidatus Dormibacteraeota bacterium]